MRGVKNTYINRIYQGYDGKRQKGKISKGKNVENKNIENQNNTNVVG